VKAHAPAAHRNRDAIAEVLAKWLPANGLVLEVASGTGEHAAHFARRFPGLVWQPSDLDQHARISIAAWREDAGLANLYPPLALDAAAAEWPIARADTLVCINMTHISPWIATLGLLAGAARILEGGALILYGPYLREGVATAPSNAAFDRSLKGRDPEWGLRRVENVAAAAAPHFSLEEAREMPANNLMLLFRRKLGVAA
jgi:hypothetical protein